MGKAFSLLEKNVIGRGPLDFEVSRVPVAGYASQQQERNGCFCPQGLMGPECTLPGPFPRLYESWHGLIWNLGLFVEVVHVT